MITGCVYKHPKHEASYFKNSFITPLLDEFSNENKDIVIMGDFDINLINYNDDKKTGNFLGTMFSSLNLFYLKLQHPLELRKN